MIRRNFKDLFSRYIGQKKVLEIRRGVNIIWQAITSCFGAGFWRNDYPWKNDDCWKNN